MSLEIDNKTARNIILHLQGLSDPPHLALGQDGLANLITRLGFVQMDSIPWMERAHHMILFSRNQTYRTKHLARLHEKQQALFENWTHDASLIPVEFWPYWKHKFSRHEARMKQKFARWQGRGYLDHVDMLFERIEQHGVLRARDLEKPKGVKQDMWQWHDGKAALEYMWRTGKLAIPKREGFQKVYDLAHRVLPAIHYNAQVSEAEFIDWACRSALNRLGYGSPSDIARFWDLVTIEEVKQWLEAVNPGEVDTVMVKSCDRSPTRVMIARPDITDLVDALPTPPKRIRMLSPFDPVIRDRKRLKWLFGFDYTIEIYVPPEKRKFGYYVFPLLEGNKLIGRVDAQARRADDTLHVSKLWLEKGARWSTTRDDKFRAELIRQSRLCDVKTIDWDNARIVS